jgi:hypothetical protein
MVQEMLHSVRRARTLNTSHALKCPSRHLLYTRHCIRPQCVTMIKFLIFA